MILASNNAHKLEEFRAIFADMGIEIIPQSVAGCHFEVDETGETFEENAYLKAITVTRATGQAAIADDPGLEVDALAGHDGGVDVVVPQHLLRLVADQRERIRLQPSAGQDDRPALDAVELHDELDRVGDDGQVLLFLQLFCQIQRRRAVVEHQVVAVLDEAAGQRGDLGFGLHVGLVADGVGQIRLRAVAEDRAAVGLGRVALFFQLVQVAADRLLRDVIILGKIADEHTLLGAELVQNFIFPLDSQHV